MKSLVLIILALIIVNLVFVKLLKMYKSIKKL